jgi:serine/threonine-protein kinase
MIGKTISHYQILEEIGAGGMGVVYKAEDTKLKRTVALKFLPPQLTSDKEAKKRFLHEARAASALDHPNICNIFEIDETQDGQMYMAMAYYEGQTLKEKISGVGENGGSPLPIHEAIDITIQIAEGLNKAHKKDIVHRDIKSANIIVTEEGTVKILDFGLAKLRGQTKLTKAGTTLGTIAYMSPEQASGDMVDHRSDIWSLGVLLYEMITGQLPFKGEYDQAVIYAIMNEDPRPANELRPGITKFLHSLIHKALEKGPEKRFQSTAEFLEALNEFQKDPKTAQQTPDSKSKLSKRKILVVSALTPVILIILALAAIHFFGGKKNSIPSLAVLPFQNLSGDPDQDFFADGIHETLLTELSRIKSLRVISRTSVVRFKKTKKSIPEIARELKVNWVLEGSAMQVGDTVRINAQLIEAKTDHHHWAEKYDREYKEILQLQSDVARDITREIRLKLTPEEKGQLEQKQAVNPEAHTAYLKGRFFWNRHHPQDAIKAREYFQEAIKLDPKYTPAYTGLFRTLFWMILWVLPPDDVEGIKKTREEAREMARKAIELDSSFSEAHLSKAYIHFYYDWDWERAEKAFKRALECNPNDVQTRIEYSFFLSCMGRHDRAVTLARETVLLDPLSSLANTRLGQVLYFAHQYDEAIVQLTTTLELNPRYLYALGQLGYTQFMKGNTQEGLRQWSKFFEYLGNKELGRIFAQGSLLEVMKKWSDQLNAPTGPVIATAEIRAWNQAMMNNKEQTLHWLRAGIRKRTSCVLMLREAPHWDFFRKEPEFQNLIQLMGFPEPKIKKKIK